MLATHVLVDGSSCVLFCFFAGLGYVSSGAGFIDAPFRCPMHGVSPAAKSGRFDVSRSLLGGGGYGVAL